MLRLYNVGIRNSFISHQLPYHEAVVVMERPLALKHNYFHLPLSLSRVSGWGDESNVVEKQHKCRDFLRLAKNATRLSFEAESCDFTLSK